MSSSYCVLYATTCSTRASEIDARISASSFLLDGTVTSPLRFLPTCATRRSSTDTFASSASLLFRYFPPQKSPKSGEIFNRLSTGNVGIFRVHSKRSFKFRTSSCVRVHKLSFMITQVVAIVSVILHMSCLMKCSD